MGKNKCLTYSITLVLFLAAKGTMVLFYCSEILGQLDIVQDSVADLECLLPFWVGSVFVHLCVCEFLCIFSHARVYICVPSSMTLHVCPGWCMYLSVFSKTWAVSLQLLVLGNSNSH